MEEFRSPIADSVCCALFNLGTLTEDDFEEKIFFEGDMDYPLESANDSGYLEFDSKEEIGETNVKAVLLSKAGLKKVISAFENKLETQILYQPTGDKLSYKRIIYEQAEHYKRVINGEETEYKAYYFK
jgi:CRISPR-associated protein Cas1